jgi:hypothetical protein
LPWHITGGVLATGRHGNSTQCHFNQRCPTHPSTRTQAIRPLAPVMSDVGGNPSARYACCTKVSEVLQLLQDDGWFLTATRGSHRQYKHPSNPAGSPFLANPAMIWLPARSTVSSSKQASRGKPHALRNRH